jgi:hypothetical protein
LANELNLGALGEPGASALPRAKVVAETSSALDEIAADSSWPYLAI